MSFLRLKAMHFRNGFVTGWILALALFVPRADAASPAYRFVNFADTNAWRPGPFPKTSCGLELEQGAAAIVSNSDPGLQQVLQMGPSDPYAAMWVDCSTLGANQTVYCELLVRPVAEQPGPGEEFLDFGGATLGFFRNENQGDIEALHVTSPKEGVWISTGISLDLDAKGRAAQWIRIDLTLDRATGRWSLQIDGVQLLAGLESVPGEAAGISLWLYGSESGGSLFNDILLTAEKPDRLRRMAALERERQWIESLKDQAPRRPQIVERVEQNGALRQTHPNIDQANQQHTAPILKAWDVTLRQGGQVIDGGGPEKIKAWSPESDGAGKLLPATVNLSADAELKPGADLSKLRWIVGNLAKYPDQWGDVYKTGDFSSGLVQTVTIPGDLIFKFYAYYVWVDGSSDDLRKLYKLSPAALAKLAAAYHQSGVAGD